MSSLKCRKRSCLYRSDHKEDLPAISFTNTNRSPAVLQTLPYLLVIGSVNPQKVDAQNPLKRMYHSISSVLTPLASGPPPLLVRCSYFFISICNFFGGRLKDSEAQPVLTLIRGGGVRTPDME